MALSTPVLSNIAAFDATNSQAFRFLSIGGDQTTAVKLTIVNQSTGAIAYTRTVNTFGDVIEYQPTEEQQLTNGTYYYAFVNTYNSAGAVSANSNLIQFYCYTTPIFQITNIPSGGILNSSFAFEVSYSQTEGEVLNSYIYNLYDIQGLLVASSGLLYAQGSALLSYTFSGFADKSSYSIEVLGQTAGGTEITTGKYLFTVRYQTPTSFSVLELNNNCEGGYITIRSNLIDINGKSNPEPPVYVKDGTAVDARTNGHYVRWNEGYELNGDFTMQLWGYEFNLNSTIIQLANANGDGVIINYRPDADDSTKVYVDCWVTSGRGPRYYIYSPSIAAPTESQKAQIWLRRTNGLYEIKLYNVG